MTFNPFLGLINEEFHQMYVDAIDAAIASCAMSVPCRISYGVTKYSECTNCIYSPVSQRSTNKYKSGGPAPFTTGLCPLCAGAGRIPVETTEDICLTPVWDYKSWIPISSVHKILAQSPEGFVQTISKIDTVNTLKRAKDIVIDTDIENYTRHKFQRWGEPEPVGLGRSSYIVTMWKRIE